jgi:hypothetical protein
MINIIKSEIKANKIIFNNDFTTVREWLVFIDFFYKL